MTEFLPLLIGLPSETCLTSWLGKYLLGCPRCGKLLSGSESHCCSGTGFQARRRVCIALPSVTTLALPSAPILHQWGCPTFLDERFPILFSTYLHQRGKYFWALFLSLALFQFFQICVMETTAIGNMVSQTIHPPHLLLSHNHSKWRGTFPSKGGSAVLPYDSHPHRTWVSFPDQTWGSLILGGSQPPDPRLFCAGGRRDLAIRYSLCGRITTAPASLPVFSLYFLPRRFHKCFSDFNSPRSIFFLCSPQYCFHPPNPWFCKERTWLILIQSLLNYKVLALEPGVRAEDLWLSTEMTLGWKGGEESKEWLLWGPQPLLPFIITSIIKYGSAQLWDELFTWVQATRDLCVQLLRLMFPGQLFATLKSGVSADRRVERGFGQRVMPRAGMSLALAPWGPLSCSGVVLLLE